MSEEALGSKYKTVNEWEEAGGEFYQESYWDWDAANGPKDTDTSAIRTILPSKQNRCGTTRRRQSGVQELKYAKYWQQSTAQKTKCNDVQFAKLPDLSEVHTNEENIWEEILQIKLLPITMQQKKMLKTNLNSATKLRLQGGLNQFKWKQRKICQQWQIKWSEIIKKLELWRSSMKQIEGHFGSGVLAYFIFLRWLFFLNCFTFTLMLLFIIMPNYLSLQRQPEHTTSSNDSINTDEISETAFDLSKIAHIFDWQPLFYGSYLKQVLVYSTNAGAPANSTTTSAAKPLNDTRTLLFVYNLPIAYACINLAYLSVCLLLLVRATAAEFKQRLKNGKWQLCQFCNLIFCGWDYCTHSSKFVSVKHKAAFSEIIHILQSKEMPRRRKNSRNSLLKKQLTRALVNFVVCILLSLAGCCTYFLFNLSVKYQRAYASRNDTASSPQVNADNRTWEEVNWNVVSFDGDAMTKNDAYLLVFFEFLPYIAIVCANFVLPSAFNYLGKFEQYTPFLAAQIVLVRNILLRLVSFAVMLFSFYHNVIPYFHSTNGCWETFVGQQFYKLALTEFFMHLLTTFFVNLLRAMCARRFKNGFVRFMGAQQFDIPRHVIDIIHLQAICWLSSFYCPFLPALLAVVFFCMFYVKKFQCLINSTLSSTFYAPSRANAIAMLILLMAYVLALLALMFAITELQPSLSCGPFSGHSSVWQTLALAFVQLPGFLKSFVLFFTTPHFIVPSVFVLTILLYYYYIVSDANCKLVEVLKNQLVLEGHDKQFLLNRLSVFIKQYQEKNEI